MNLLYTQINFFLGQINCPLILLGGYKENTVNLYLQNYSKYVIIALYVFIWEVFLWED